MGKIDRAVGINRDDTELMWIKYHSIFTKRVAVVANSLAINNGECAVDGLVTQRSSQDCVVFDKDLSQVIVAHLPNRNQVALLNTSKTFQDLIFTYFCKKFPKLTAHPTVYQYMNGMAAGRKLLISMVNMCNWEAGLNSTLIAITNLLNKIDGRYHPIYLALLSDIFMLNPACAVAI